MRLYQLNGTEAEVAAALRLREVSGVLLNLAAQSPAEADLRRAGFVPMPRNIQVVMNLFSERVVSRARRRNVKRSVDAWKAAEAKLTLLRAAEVAPEVLDRLYFELFVPRLYARGWSPFGIHNYRGFRRLIGSNTWIALVHCTGRLVGGALMKEAPINGAALAGHLADGPSLIGQVYVLDERLADARRGFLVELGVVATAHGFRTLSLGEDLPWMQAAYATVVSEKLASGDTLLFEVDGPTVWGHFENFGDHVLCFVRTATGIDLQADVVLTEVAAHMSKRILRLQTGD